MGNVAGTHEGPPTGQDQPLRQGSTYHVGGDEDRGTDLCQTDARKLLLLDVVYHGQETRLESADMDTQDTQASPTGKQTSVTKAGLSWSDLR